MMGIYFTTEVKSLSQISLLYYYNVLAELEHVRHTDITHLSAKQPVSELYQLRMEVPFYGAGTEGIEKRAG